MTPEEREAFLSNQAIPFCFAEWPTPACNAYLERLLNSAEECVNYEFAWGAGALVIEYEMPGRVRRIGLFVCDDRTGAGHLRLLEIERIDCEVREVNHETH